MAVRFYVVEIFVVFLMGFLPGLVAFYLGGSQLVEATFKSLTPNSVVVDIALILGVIYFTLAFFDWYFLKSSKFANNFFWYCRNIFSQAGLGIHALLRVGAGMFFCLFVLWATHEPSTIDASKTIFLLSYGLAMFVESLLLTYVFQKSIKYKRSNHSSENTFNF